MNTTEIENLLRHAPRPQPPANLRARLQAQAPSSTRNRRSGEARPSPGLRSWLARWWPALVPAAISLACAAVLTLQQREMKDLRTSLQTGPGSAATGGATPSTAPTAAAATAASPAEQAEITQLKAQAQKLGSEIAQLERTRTENQKLRAQLAAAPSPTLSAEETKDLEAARDKDSTIVCVSNLKQLGLAVRLWSTDNGDTTPQNLISMTNEMNTPKILVCPADTARQPARDWASFTPANCSYDYLAPSAPDTEPQRILFRCPVHGSVTLCDGSVQMGVAKTRLDWIVQREGKLYLQPTETPAAPAPPPPDGNNTGQ